MGRWAVVDDSPRWKPCGGLIVAHALVKRKIGPEVRWMLEPTPSLCCSLHPFIPWPIALQRAQSIPWAEGPIPNGFGSGPITSALGFGGGRRCRARVWPSIASDQ